MLVGYINCKSDKTCYFKNFILIFYKIILNIYSCNLFVFMRQTKLCLKFERNVVLSILNILKKLLSIISLQLLLCHNSFLQISILLRTSHTF